MQLKRDTDYALRILCCCVKETNPRGISLKQLCQEAVVPRTIAARLCRALTKEDILTENILNNHFFYAFNRKASDKSLYDIIRITEGSAGLFEVFDHSTQFYGNCENSLKLIDEWFTNGLKGIRIQNFTEKCAATDEN